MADNGNRGPNDFRGRNGKRRREPPIIDASATEVPLDQAAGASTPDGSETAGTSPRETAASEPATDPVLFGGGRRAAEPEPAASAVPAGDSTPEPLRAETVGAEPLGEPRIVPSALDGEPAPGEPTTPTPVPSEAGTAEHGADAARSPDAAAPSTASSEVTDTAGKPVEPAMTGEATTEAAPSAVPAFGAASEASEAAPEAARGASAADAVPPRFTPAAPGPRPSVSPAAMSSAAPARSGGGAAWLLGLSNLALLAALGWVLYTAPQRDGHAELAELRSKVAALEARPDPSQAQNQAQGQVQTSVAALDKRVTAGLGAAEADRAALKQSVAGLSTKLDAVAQAAENAKADADRAASAAGAAQSDANRAPPTGAAAAATVGALAALAAKVEEVDRGVSALSADQTKTAKAVADLPKPVPPDFGPTDARIAGVETQLSGKLAALDGRLTSLDGKVNGYDARLNDFDAKVNGVDGKINGFAARMNGFEARDNGFESKLTDAAAGLDRLQNTVANLPKVDLSPLQAATAGLGAEVARLQGLVSAAKDGTRVTEARAVGSADEARATPIALVGQSVVRAIADGRPYASDLDALKALGAEPEAVAKLQPLAAKGAPSAAALRAQWDAVSGDVLAAVAPAQARSPLDRLSAGALSLVQVRQVGAAKGDDAGAVVTQVGAALDADDVAGALAAWSKLPQAGQDRSKDWAAAARARAEAAQAAQGLVARAIATLGRTRS